MTWPTPRSREAREAPDLDPDYVSALTLAYHKTACKLSGRALHACPYKTFHRSTVEKMLRFAAALTPSDPQTPEPT